MTARGRIVDRVSAGSFSWSFRHFRGVRFSRLFTLFWYCAGSVSYWSWSPTAASVPAPPAQCLATHPVNGYSKTSDAPHRQRYVQYTHRSWLILMPANRNTHRLTYSSTSLLCRAHLTSARIGPNRNPDRNPNRSRSIQVYMCSSPLNPHGRDRERFSESPNEPDKHRGDSHQHRFAGICSFYPFLRKQHV